MATQKERRAVGTTRLAWDTLNLHWGTMLLMLAAEVALRVVAYAPFYLLLTQKKENIPSLYYIAACLILSMLLVLPSRFYFHARMRHLIGGTRYSPVIDDRGRQTALRPICVNADAKGVYPDYWHCLRLALYRFGLGLLWGLPCAALTAGWCYGHWVMNFNEFWPILRKISQLFGGEYYDLGTAVWMLAILLTGVIFFLGWRRGLVTDFTRIAGREDKRVFEVSREVRKGNVSRLMRHTLSQILYLLPSLAACGVVLYNYARASLEWTGSISSFATKLMTFLKTPLSGETLTMLLLIALLLHAPLAFFRKLRSASLMYTLYGERAARGKEQNHAA